MMARRSMLIRMSRRKTIGRQRAPSTLATPRPRGTNARLPLLLRPGERIPERRGSHNDRKDPRHRTTTATTIATTTTSNICDDDDDDDTSAMSLFPASGSRFPESRSIASKRFLWSKSAMFATTTTTTTRTASSFYSSSSSSGRPLSTSSTTADDNAGVAPPDKESSHQESFKVTRIRTRSGEMDSVNLPPAEILKQTCILPRDLLSLDLTPRRDPGSRPTSSGSSSSGAAVEAAGNDGSDSDGDDDDDEEVEVEEQTKAQLENDDDPRSFSAASLWQRNRPHNLGQRPLTAILPRVDSILLSFGNIRAVANRDSVFVLDAHTKVAQSFAQDLSRAFAQQQSSGSSGPSSSSDDPPELIFLEAVLRDTVDTYFRRIALFEPIVEGLLTRVGKEVFGGQSGVQQLAPLKDSLQSFELEVKKSLECLQSLLNDDEEMIRLLLSEQAAARDSGVPVNLERHQHVEMLVGIYARQLSNLLHEIDYLLGRVQSKQEFVTLALAGYRNRLVRMNVHITILGVSTGIVTTVTGVFGMNLVSGIEDSATAFAIVSGGATAAALTVAGMSHSFISQGALRRQTAEHMAGNETLVSALSDTPALDYVVKEMMHGNRSLSRDDLRGLLVEARRSRTVEREEIDLLFDVLDTHKDDQLSSKDFRYGSPR